MIFDFMCEICKATFSISSTYLGKRDKNILCPACDNPLPESIFNNLKTMSISIEKICKEQATNRNGTKNTVIVKNIQSFNP